jgi:PAS domain S-box-containing protein
VAVVKSLSPSPPERSLEGWAQILFDGIDDAVWIHDLAGNILEVNVAACQRLGYTREELLALTTHNIDDPNFTAPPGNRPGQPKSRGQLRREGRHRTKDGRLIAVEVTTTAVHHDGKPAFLAIVRDITQIKATEEAMRRQTNLHTTQFAVTRALDECPDLEGAGPVILRCICEGLGWDAGSLWLLDPADRVLRCCSAWHRPDLVGQEFAEVSRQMTLAAGHGLAGRVWSTHRAAFVPDIAADTNCPRQDVALRTGLKCGFAFPIRGVNETIGVIELFHRRLEEHDAALVSAMATMGSQIGQAIERRRVEKALRESEAFYHTLVESLPQNIYRKDRQGRISFANHHYCNTLHKSLHELVGKTDFDLFPAHLAQKYVEDDRKVMEAGKIFEAVEEHVTPDGTKLYVQVVKCPVWDNNGQAIGTQGVFWDVTERRRAEEAIAASERRYRQLTEATQDGIVLADQEGRINLFNPAAERLFGYQAVEVVGQLLEILMPEHLQGQHQAGFQRFLTTRQPKIIGRPVELEGRRKDGSTFELEVALSVIEVGSNIQFLGSIRDLTERNRIRAALVQNEKLASIGLLSAGVAHEINNPLAFVANNLVVLERDSKGLLEVLDLHQGMLPRLAEIDAESAAKIAQLAEQIDLVYVRENISRLLSRTREGVDRVTRIVRSLRGLARTDTPKRQDTEVPVLVESALDILRGRLKRQNVEVVTNYEPDSVVMCVATQISQVVLNLLVNAQQAVESAARAEGRITVATRRQGDDMLIEVGDNGTGIDPACLPKLFDPFFTTKEVGEGTGLGLSIVHNIIRAHGGRVEVESQLGVGSSFRVYLPLHTSGEAS